MPRPKILTFECPACGDLYANHALDGLAWCMEALYGSMLHAIDEQIETVDTRGRT